MKRNPVDHRQNGRLIQLLDLYGMTPVIFWQLIRQFINVKMPPSLRIWVQKQKFLAYSNLEVLSQVFNIQVNGELKANFLRTPPKNLNLQHLNYNFVETPKILSHQSSVSDVTIFRHHYFCHYHNSGYASRPVADFLPACLVLAVQLQ